MKSNEELNTINEEVETQNKQRRILTEEELAQVYGGGTWAPVGKDDDPFGDVL